MFSFLHIVNMFCTISYCLKRKRTLRSLSRYRIAMTIIDRGDNGESTAHINEFSKHCLQWEKQPIRWGHPHGWSVEISWLFFFKIILKIVATCYSNSWFHSHLLLSVYFNFGSSIIFYLFLELEFDNKSTHCDTF